MVTVVLVGRPNVGKSTLFNRLTGNRLALVHSRSHTTRDWRSAEVRMGDLCFTLLDTAGLEDRSDYALGVQIYQKTRDVLRYADILLFLVDVRSGVTPVDHFFANRVLRCCGVPVIVVANKAEGCSSVLEVLDLGFDDVVALSAEHGIGIPALYEVLLCVVGRLRERVGTFEGFERLRATSGDGSFEGSTRLQATSEAVSFEGSTRVQAASGDGGFEGFERLRATSGDGGFEGSTRVQAVSGDGGFEGSTRVQAASGDGGFEGSTRVQAALGDGGFEESARVQAALGNGGFEGSERLREGVEGITLAFAGRPNVGKSTLFNYFVGYDRVLVDSCAGTTRDPVSLLWRWGGYSFRLVDTAGIRRCSARRTDTLEYLSVERAWDVFEYAQVVLLLIDGRCDLDHQDLRIAERVIDEGRCLVLALNCIDTLEHVASTLEHIHQRLQRSLTQVRGIPVYPISALYGYGINDLLEGMVRQYWRWSKRVSTSRLNRWLAVQTERHPLPLVRRRRPKLRYMTQIRSRPPTFAVWIKRTEYVPEHYRRYLLQGLRDTFDFDGVPLRLSCRMYRGDRGGRC